MRRARPPVLVLAVLLSATAAAHAQQSDQPAAASLEKPTVAPAVPAVDVVTLEGGGRLVGTVLAMESDGRLRLKGPAFQGEVVVAAGAVSSVTFRPAATPTAAAEVALVGGERLRGALTAVTPEAVILDGPAGRLSVPRRAVRAVNLVSVADVLIGSAFETGKLDPWKTRMPASAWTFEDGKAVYHIRCPYAGILSADLDKAEAFTIEARMSVASPSMPQGLAFTGDGVTVRASIMGGRDGLTHRLYCSGRGQSSPVSGTVDPQLIPSGTGVFRLAYDPAAGKAWFWLESILLGELEVPPAITGKKTMMIDMSGLACAIEYARVLRGVVSPGGLIDTGPGPTGAGTLIEFANSDRVEASQVTLAGGRATLATDVGEVRCPQGVLVRMVFSRQEPEEKPAEGAETRIEGCFGRLRLQSARLTADELIGRSEVLGEVRLRREGLSRIRFGPAAATVPPPETAVADP